MSKRPRPPGSTTALGRLPSPLARHLVGPGRGRAGDLPDRAHDLCDLPDRRYHPAVVAQKRRPRSASWPTAASCSGWAGREPQRAGHRRCVATGQRPPPDAGAAGVQGARSSPAAPKSTTRSNSSKTPLRTNRQRPRRRRVVPTTHPATARRVARAGRRQQGETSQEGLNTRSAVITARSQATIGRRQRSRCRDQGTTTAATGPARSQLARPISRQPQLGPPMRRRVITRPGWTR